VRVTIGKAEERIAGSGMEAQAGVQQDAGNGTPSIPTSIIES
jgi:hypothetical protein